jgi:serine/threonine protein kinase/WD40 repeat protein/predicted  nucleic acid-binding Zn-ribbon protein
LHLFIIFIFADFCNVRHNVVIGVTLHKAIKDSMTNLTGSVIKGYEIRDQVGAGGFGAVYRAYQGVIEREVAIKIILPEHANQPEFIRGFESEAQIVARLEHPYIIPLFDYWRDPEGAFLVMRFLRGGSLTKRLKNGAIPLEDCIRMVEQIASALSTAHRNGVVHRDLKPDNILLDEEGNAFLTDFGISKLVGKDSTSEDISGSLRYIAPEQLRAEPPSTSVDIYSLGLMIFEMLTGTYPFGEIPPTQIIMKHLNDPIPDLRDYLPDAPEVLNDILQKATAKEIEDRYSDPRQIVADMRNAISRTNAPMVLEAIDYSEIPNPYKGLRAFQEADAADFFGRENLVNQLLDRLKEDHPYSRFLSVVGPSGSGKSSAVRAGIIPALRAGALPNSQQWFVVDMVPGAQPLRQLEAILVSIAPRPPSRLYEMLKADTAGLVWAVERVLSDVDGDLLLFIDQFEEVFTLVEDEAERLHFLNVLRAAVLAPDSRVRVIITLRADFTDRPLEYVDFGELMRLRTEFVLPLSAQEIERAITGPANRVGLQIQTELVAGIVSDVREEPGALPLLQYALTEVFERREENRLTLAGYQSSGGVLGALARRAEEVYVGLDDEQQRITRQMMLRLVTLGEGTEDTRRRARRAEIADVVKNNVGLQDILDRFGQYRLLTFDFEPGTREPTLEVAHEALIREWQRLRSWLDTSRADVRLQRVLAGEANEWEKSNRDSSFLLSGARLTSYEEWASSTDLALTDREQNYITASIEERRIKNIAEEARKKREEETAQRAELFAKRATQLRRAATVLGVVGVLALIAVVVAGVQVSNTQVQVAEGQTQVAGVQPTLLIAQQQIDGAQTQIAGVQPTLENAEQQIDGAQTQIAGVQPTLNAGQTQIAGVEPTLQIANQRVDLAQTQIAGVQPTLDAGQTQIAGVEPTLQIANQRVDDAQTQIAGVQPTLDAGQTQIAGVEPTLQLANQRVDSAQTQIAGVQPTLDAGQTQIAGVEPTLQIANLRVNSAETQVAQVQPTVQAAQQQLDNSQTQIAGVQPTLQAGQTQVAGVGPTVQAANLRVNSAETQVAQVQPTVQAAQQQLDNSQTQIAGVQPTLQAGQTQVAGVGPTLNAANLRVDSAETQVAQVQPTVQAAQQQLDDSQTQIAGVQPTLQAGQTQVAGVEPTLQAANLRVDSAETQVAQVQPTIQAAQAQIDAIVPTLDSAQTQVAGVQPTLLAANLRVDSAETQVAGVQPTLTAAQDQINAIVPTLDSAETQVAGVRPTLAFAETSVAAVQPTLTAAQNQIDGVKPTLSSAETQIAGVVPTLQAVEAEVQSQRNISDALRLIRSAQQLLEAGNPDLAIALVLEAYRLNPSLGETQRILNNAIPLTVRLNLTDSEGSNYFSTQSNYITLQNDGDEKLLEADRFIATNDNGFQLFSPDERFLAVATGASVQIWSPTTRTLLQTLNTDQVVTTMVFSADGQRIVVGTQRGGVQVWDAGTGVQLHALNGHRGEVLSLAYSPTEPKVISGGDDRVAILWNVDEGIELQRLIDHTAPILKVAFNGNGSEAYSYALDDNQPKIGVFKLGIAPAFRNPTAEYRAISPSGEIAVVGGKQFAFVSLYDADSGVKLRDFQRGNTSTDQIKHIVFSNDGRSLLVHVEARDYVADSYFVIGRRVEHWSIETGELLGTLDPKQVDPTSWDVYSLGFSPDDGRALVGARFSLTYSITLWDLNTYTALRQFKGHQASPVQVAFSSNSTFAVSSSTDGNVRVWDIGSGESDILQRIPIANAQSLEGFGLSGDGTQAYILFNGQSGGVYNLVDGSEDRNRRFFTGAQTQAVFNPKFPQVVTITADAMILWDTSTGDRLHIFEEIDANAVRGLAFKADGTQLYYSVSGQIFAYDIQNDTTLSITRANAPFIAASPNGEFIAYTTGNTIAIYDLIEATVSQSMAYEGGKITSLAYSPDGGRLITAIGEPDNVAVIWDIRTQSQLFTLVGHRADVTAAIFSPDSLQAVTGSLDNTLIVWDATSGQVIRQFVGHTAPVRQLQFLPQGGVVYSISTNVQDGIIGWEVESAQDTVNWTYNNRYIQEINCSQRRQYGVEPQCVFDTIPTPGPTPTSQASPTATASPTLRPTFTPSPTPIPTGVIQTDGGAAANLRTGAGPGFALVTQVPSGTTVQILEVQEDIGWAKVRLPNGTEGWLILGIIRR